MSISNLSEPRFPTISDKGNVIWRLKIYLDSCFELKFNSIDSEQEFIQKLIKIRIYLILL